MSNPDRLTRPCTACRLETSFRSSLSVVVAAVGAEEIEGKEVTQDVAEELIIPEAEELVVDTEPEAVELGAETGLELMQRIRDLVEMGEKLNLQTTP